MSHWAEIDLPRRLLAPTARVDRGLTWDRLPGSTLCIHVGTPIAASPFVSSSSIERNTIVIALTRTSGDLVVRTVDRASARLVDGEGTKPASADVIFQRKVEKGRPTTPRWELLPSRPVSRGAGLRGLRD